MLVESAAPFPALPEDLFYLDTPDCSSPEPSDCGGSDACLDSSLALRGAEELVAPLCDRVLAALAGVISVDKVQPASVASLFREKIAEGADTAFFIVNLATVVRKYAEWVHYLPRVRPFYAVKCNPNPGILRTLQALGCGFDCASKNEMNLVLNMGVPAQDIIFANPTKMKAHIEYASQSGVSLMTFDNSEELQKIKRFFPNAKLILRLLPPDSNSALCCFGSKFGANAKQARDLVVLARDLGLNLVGCSFHVGSGCFSTDAYVGAITFAREMFDFGREHGFEMNLLDIGGGWPGTDDVALPFAKIAAVVGPLIDRLFDAGVTVIAEPGRYFSSQCASLAVNVIAKRNASDGASGSVLYYVSDGVYGSFNSLFFDHAVAKPMILSSASASDETRPSTIFGPTCDSIDKIAENIELPDLSVGDWLWFESMGAYTMASSSSFNGFEPPPAQYIMMV